MSTPSSKYEYIASKVDALQRSDSFFKDKTKPYIFSALCVKSYFYKNPSDQPSDKDLEAMIVDGTGDGGVDILMSDPYSETSDLIIGQSKFYQNINTQAVRESCIRMAEFYKDMLNGHFDGINRKVQSRFLTLNAEVGEESKIIFILFTSAPRKSIDVEAIERRFYDQFSDTSNIELLILFASDVAEKIKEAASRRPTVDVGTIRIDKAKNFLVYGEDAVIVNVSAFSLKKLYAQHGINLLARNLRYHIKSGREIDKAIDESINNYPDLFWMKNNGITLICDSFQINGEEVSLTNFSVINGGQTVYVFHRSKNISQDHDFYLPCKIICSRGNTTDEKNSYCLEIAKAANAQKPIKDIDLKANAPEQVRFVQAMRDVGIYYQTKRGETIPKTFQAAYMNIDLAEAGKLCLCAIFQIPCASKAKPSLLYKPQYYDIIFNGDQSKIARICRDMLYVDYFFKNTFLDEYDKLHKDFGQTYVNSISFVHNSRTACIAFAALTSRYRQGNITDKHIGSMAAAQSDSDIYDTFKSADNIRYIFPDSIFLHKDKCDDLLRRLFSVFIKAGITVYMITKDFAPAVTAANFLKIDKNYYKIISAQWQQMKPEIAKIFDEFGM